MDISEATDTSNPNINSSSQDLKFESEQKAHDKSENPHLNKNISSTQNATDSHPLMFTCTSPISPDFPDLIPKKPKSKHYEKHTVKPETAEEGTEYGSLEKQLHFDLPLSQEYNELPDFPESPSALKKSLMYDLPLEVNNTELSDTENDKSVYEAHLSSNLQNVCLTMNEKEGNLNFLAHKKRSNKLRRVKVMETEASEESDISSLDSISESLKSEHVFTGQLEIGSEERENDNSPEPIEPLSAADERRHARHWQRMVLPGGEQRTIDMRVIEPYKRVLSHGGYLRAGGHTAIVIFSACYLPDRSRVDYVYVMDNLFLYKSKNLSTKHFDSHDLLFFIVNREVIGWIISFYLFDTPKRSNKKFS